MRALRQISDGLSGLINRLFSKQLSGIGFGLFRISFFSILLIEIIQMFFMRDVVFSEHLNLYTIALVVWGIAVAFIILGYQTKIASYISFSFTTLIISRFLDFEYHIDCVYMGVSFLCLWAPLENRISLSNFLSKKTSRDVPLAYYLLIVAVGLGSLYAESSIHKLNTKVWTEGLGFWLPTSLPHFTFFDWSFLLNNKDLSMLVGYVALAFETSFIFLVWFKKARIPLLIVGVGLHVGILLAYPIPLFGLAMLCQYWLLVPDSWLKKLATKRSVFYAYSKKEMRIYGAIASLAIVMQLLAFAVSPGVDKFLDRGVGRYILKSSLWTQRMRIMLFGMTPHGVFLDGHYTARLYEYKLDARVFFDNGVETDYPDILDGHISGRIWANWIFRVGGHEYSDPYAQDYIQRYLNHWYKRHDISPQNPSTIEITVRRRSFKIDSIEWTPDFYHTLSEKPWEVVDSFRLDKFVR